MLPKQSIRTCKKEKNSQNHVHNWTPQAVDLLTKSFSCIHIHSCTGEAIYEIGVEDNGLMTGLSDEDMDSSLDTLREMARRLGATIQVLRERVVTTEHGTRTVSEVLVRKVGVFESVSAIYQYWG